MQKNIIIALLFAIIITIFALLNSSPVPINLLFVELDISVALVILIAAALGAILVYSLNMFAKMKAKKKLSISEKALLDLKKECQKLEEQVAKYEVNTELDNESTEGVANDQNESDVKNTPTIED